MVSHSVEHTKTHHRSDTASYVRNENTVSLWDKFKPGLLSHQGFKLLESWKLHKLLEASPFPSIDNGKGDTILKLTDARNLSHQHISDGR